MTLSLSLFAAVYGDSEIQLAEVTWDKENYTLNDEAIIRVFDNDSNQNSNFEDTITVDIWSDSDAGGFDLILNETGINTGIFEGSIFFVSNEFSDEQQKLLGVSDGDTIVAEYKDETIPSTLYSSYDNIDVTGTSKFTINLTLEQTFSFANTSIVNSGGVKITSVERDQTFWIMSEITNLSNSEKFFAFSVGIEDERGQIIDEKEETGNLSPSQSHNPALSFSISKSGNYIAKTFLSNDANNSGLFFSEIHLKVEKTPYDLLDDKKFVIGNVQLDKNNYELSDVPQIQVMDRDMNIDPLQKDSFTVDMWSDSDRGGIDLIVTETSRDSGIFEGSLILSTTKESSDNILRVSSGDKITVNYNDITIPSSQSNAEKLKVTADAYVEKDNRNKAVIPEWVRNIFIWYAEDRISEDELLRSIEFLIEQNIVTVNTS